jgi:hypothetical protein
MAKAQRKRPGIHLLLKRYRTLFRIPENLNHYSKKDYEIAERKFIKHVLTEHMAEIQ